MGDMTETPEAPERVAVRYTGSQPIRLADSAGANPPHITPGAIVVVNGWAADILVQGDAWDPAAGAALDQALKDAGLPTTGSADERRDRLAAHEGDLAAQLAAQVTDDQPTTDDEQENDRG